MDYKYPLFYPYLSPKIRRAVEKTLRTRWIGQGPKVDEFEKKIGEKFNLKYPLAVNSGTSALELAYELVGIKEGDEVITTPYTCSATNIPLVRRKAKIVFADIREDTMNIDREDIKRKITSKTKAIVNVNMAGIKNDIGKFPVPVITDACQSLGFKNGDYVVYSFQAIKHFSTGDGGLLICPNEKFYREAKLKRWFGIDREKKRAYDWQAYREREMTFNIKYAGYKYQMNDIAASMGIEGLKAYDAILVHRSKLFRLYKKLLGRINGIKVIDGKENVYWLITILVERRDDFARKLKEKSIETNLVQIRNDIYKLFGGKRKRLPIMNKIEDKYISLPLNPKITTMDVKYICSVIKEGW